MPQARRGATAILASGITKRFPGVIALQAVDFDVREGEVHVLVGENGAGKSTLIKILAGVFPPDEGRLEIAGAAATLRDPRHAIALGIATIYQERSLVPDLTVAENVLLGREPVRGGWLARIDRRAALRETRELLLPLGLTLNPETPVRALGLAEQQMVEIAKALSARARCVIMDEPTASLSRAEVDRLFGTIRRLRDRGVAIVYISHRLHEVPALANRVTVLRDGRRIGTLDAGEARPDRLVQMMVGREIRDQYPRVRGPRGPAVLRLEGLGAPGAFEDIDLEVHAGEILGLAGVLGSGCRELLWAVFGARPAAQGRIWVGETPLDDPSPRRAIRRGLGFLPEDRKRHGLILPFNVRENAALASLAQFSPWGWMESEPERAAVGRAAAHLGVVPAGIETPVQTLSGGNQQKVVLARNLLARSRILLFDEPTRGVDVGAKLEVYRLMNRLTAEGAGIVLVSSDLPELVGMSDRIVVLRRGRIAGTLGHQEATQERVIALAVGSESGAGTGESLGNAG